MHPGASAALKDIGRTGFRAIVIIPIGPYDGIVTGHRYGASEIVSGRSIAGRQFGHLMPGASRKVIKDINGTGIRAIVIVPGSPYHGILTGYRYGSAEIVPSLPIISGQFGHLPPGISDAIQNIRRTGISSHVIIIGSAYNGIITEYRYGVTEMVAAMPIPG